MKVCIVYCHPSEDSLTRHLKDSFIKGLESSGHSYILSDLYKMNFHTDMSEAEYKREAFYKLDAPVPSDVIIEQEKINSCDIIVFMYPLFWSEAPAKLVGWFNRVFTYGFAYGDNRTMKTLDKALVLVSAGNTLDYFEETGIGSAMKKVFLDDRLFDRVKHKEMIIFEATSRENEALASNSRKLNWDKHLERAFELGAGL